MTRVQRRPEVLWRRTLGAVLILPPGHDGPLMLEGTAAAIWELLGEPRDAHGLACALLPDTQPDAAVLGDVEHFLAELTTAGAVVEG